MRETPSRRSGFYLLIGSTLAVAVVACLLPRIPQPLTYHDFADKRAWLGVANFGDVISNLPFAIVGVWGLAWMASGRRDEQFVDVREKWPYAVLFLGLLLTAAGSSYYHLAPDSQRLVWDRIPMTMVFMPLVAALIAERISLRLGLWLLPILTAIGVGSVLQWHWSELRGEGDLRFYAAVQAYAVVAVLVMVMVFLPAKYTRTRDLGWVAGFYLLAKILEMEDRAIFSLGHMVSGHTLKHLCAGASGYFILRMVRKRVPTLRADWKESAGGTSPAPTT